MLLPPAKHQCAAPPERDQSGSDIYPGFSTLSSQSRRRDLCPEQRPHPMPSNRMTVGAARESIGLAYLTLRLGAAPGLRALVQGSSRPLLAERRDPRRTSLPLDRGRGLGRDVVDDTVDARDLVHDPRADLAKDVVWELGPVGRHAVLRGDRPDRDDVGVSPAIAHDADASDGGQDRERLPQRAVKTRALDLVDDDPVGLAERVQPLGGDLADDPDREPRPRERLAEDDRLRQPHLEPDRPDLVLEQVAQWLDELEAKVGRQPADVVVGLDLLGGLRLRGGALDD